MTTSLLKVARIIDIDEDTVIIIYARTTYEEISDPSTTPLVVTLDATGNKLLSTVRSDKAVTYRRIDRTTHPKATEIGKWVDQVKHKLYDLMQQEVNPSYTGKPLYTYIAVLEKVSDI